MTKHGNKHRVQLTLSSRAWMILEECKKQLPNNYNKDRATSLLVEKAIISSLTDPREQLVMRIKELAKEREILEEQIRIIDEKREQAKIQTVQAERVNARVQAARGR